MAFRELLALRRSGESFNVYHQRMRPPELEQSVAQRARNVQFGQFLKQRHDDRVVELFLAWWQYGNFAADVKWLPQHINNVEVVARNPQQGTLAIEHTRIYAFRGHQNAERWLADVAAEVESAPALQSPGREYDIILPTEAFKGLNEKKRRSFTSSLIEWLLCELKQLSPGEHRLVSPALPPKTEAVEITIRVDDVPLGSELIRVSGMLPNDAKTRALPQVDKALASKFTKLKTTNAQSRVLLIELPTLDTIPSLIAETIQQSPEYAHDLQAINFVVLAKTFEEAGKGTGWFFAYDTTSYALRDVGHLTWVAA